MKEKCPVSHKVKYVTHLKCVNWIKKRCLFLGRKPMRNLVKAKVTQACLTLCDPMGYTVHGLLQASILFFKG